VESDVTGNAQRRPVLVFDGDCAFCTSSAHQLERISPEAEIVPWQLTDLDELGITAAQATEAVQWIGADGTIRSGHEAIAAALGTAGWPWRIAGRLITLPGISTLAAVTYRWIARNRYRLPGGTPACAVDQGAADGSKRS
jgi:predicted DCC family thiol-disulfide oxidoreductase YuxK